MNQTVVSPGRRAKLTSVSVLKWLQHRGVARHCVPPGKPMRNGSVASLTAPPGDECLNEQPHVRLSHARNLIAAWCDGCEHDRPGAGLDNPASRTHLERPGEDQARTGLAPGSRAFPGTGQ